MRGEGNPSVQFPSCPVMALECDYILIEKGMFFFLIITKVLLGPKGYVCARGDCFHCPLYILLVSSAFIFEQANIMFVI